MPQPGTYQKHYVCPDRRKVPFYFYYVGRLLSNITETMHIVITNNFRMEVNQDFIDWLEPIEPGDMPPAVNEAKARQANTPNLSKHRGGEGMPSHREVEKSFRWPGQR